MIILTDDDLEAIKNGEIIVVYVNGEEVGIVGKTYLLNKEYIYLIRGE